MVSDDNGNIDTAQTALVADFKAEKDNVTITDMIVTGAGGTLATTSAVYLYDGSTLLGSASFTGSTSTISNSSGLITIPRDTTKALTLKFTYTGASTTPSTSTLSFANTGITAQASDGTDVPIARKVGGTISSDIMRVIIQSPVFAYVSSSVSYTAPSFGTDTGTLSGSLKFNVTAVGDSIAIATTTGGPFLVNLVADDGNPVATSGPVSVSFAQPSAGVTLTGGYYKIGEDETATFELVLSARTSSLAFAGQQGFYHFELASTTWRWGSAFNTNPVGADITYLDTGVFKTTSANVSF